MKICHDTPERQRKRLKTFLSPRRSKLRPYLGLLAIKNYIVLKNGSLPGNNPSIKWYTNQLSKLGVSQNYWGVRNQLKKMAQARIFKEKRVIRPVANPVGGRHRLTRLELAEYYLKEKVFDSLQHVMKDIFQITSLSDLLTHLPNKQTNRVSNLKKPQQMNKKTI